MPAALRLTGHSREGHHTILLSSTGAESIPPSPQHPFLLLPRLQERLMSSRRLFLFFFSVHF